MNRGRTPRVNGILIPSLLILLAGCISGTSMDGDVPGSSAQGSGPRVEFDPLAHPNPEVPLPNDISTVLDPTLPTGRQVNIRHTAPTQFERGIRSEINRLDGFGTFAPIIIPFDGPLDLGTLGPDSVKVINVDPASPRYGREVALDLPEDRSRSMYPMEIAPWPFPPHSPHAMARQMIYDPGHQGAVGSADYVDFYERETDTLLLRVVTPLDQQTEYMVVLTKDLRGENGDPVRSPFPEPVHVAQSRSYERALPLLREKGVEPEAVAFSWFFTTQTTTRDLETISDGLHGRGPLAGLPELVPAVFTQVADTGTGIDGLFCPPHGDNPCRDNRWILQAELLAPFMGLLAVDGIDDLIRTVGILFMAVDLGIDVKMLVDLDAIDYFVFGRFQTPEFREPGSEMIRMDYRTGEASVRAAEVPWMIAVPRPTPGHQAPFPVVLHAHGIPSLRWQLITEANAWAKKGFATIAITVPMHEPILTVKDVDILIRSAVEGVAAASCEGLSGTELEQCVAQGVAGIDSLLDGLGKGVVELLNCIVFGECGGVEGGFQDALEVFLTSGFMKQLLVEGRAEDVDGDGNTDHGVIFTADLFKSRDRIRQYMVEQMQLLQLLKGLDQAGVPPAVANPGAAGYEELAANLLAGDFNADGVLDLGGSVAYGPYEPGTLPSEAVGEQRYFRSGMSFGGITNSILMAVEPDVRTAAISVPGGGLTDIMTRMDLHAVSDPIYHEILGPIVVVEPAGDPQDAVAAGSQGPRPMKVGFVRRGKKERVDLLGGELVSMWSATLPGEIFEMTLPVGGALRILNEENGEEATISWADLWEGEPLCRQSVFQEGLDWTGSWGCASHGIASDKGDRVLFTVLDPAGGIVDQAETRAPARGMGKMRNTPDHRFFVNLGQIALEAADPINYARHWFLDPLGGNGRPRHPVKNMMVANVPGDMFVPINAQVAVARAAGLFGSASNECDGWPRSLDACGSTWEEISRDCDCMNMHWVLHDVMVGNYFVGEPRYDLDGLADGVSPECDPHTSPLIDNRDRGAGYSYVRFPYSYVWCDYNYVEPANRGMHWLMASFVNPDIATNWSAYYQNQMADYFDTEGFAADPDPQPDCTCAGFRGEEPCPYLP